MKADSWEIAPIERNYEITRKDVTKDKLLKYGTWLSPILLPAIPSLILLLFGIILTSPFLAALSFVWLIAGFIFGLIFTGFIIYYRQKWLSDIRERIAVDGIKTEEVDWFKHELTGAERKSLKELENHNRLLGDAYRETLASRLTATRIIKTTKSELQLVKKRENKLRNLKSETSVELQKVLQGDRGKLEEIKKEAEQMRVEAESRLQLIEAAARRGTNLADTELALKRLTSRASELPLALEALKMEEEIRKELEAGEELAAKPKIK
jgi:hypothetical protein